MSSIRAPAAVVIPVSTVSVMSLETAELVWENAVFAPARKS